MAASIHATNRSSGGCRRSTPVTSAANRGCSGLALGSIMFFPLTVSPARSPGRRNAAAAAVHRKADLVAGAERSLRVDAGHGEARLPGPGLDQDFRAELLDHLDPASKSDSADAPPSTRCSGAF